MWWTATPAGWRASSACQMLLPICCCEGAPLRPLSALGVRLVQPLAESRRRQQPPAGWHCDLHARWLSAAAAQACPPSFAGLPLLRFCIINCMPGLQQPAAPARTQHAQYHSFFPFWHWPARVCTASRPISCAASLLQGHLPAPLGWPCSAAANCVVAVQLQGMLLLKQVVTTPGSRDGGCERWGRRYGGGTHSKQPRGRRRGAR